MRAGARGVALGAPPTSGSAAKAVLVTPSQAKNTSTTSARFRTMDRRWFRFTDLVSLDEEVLEDGEKRDAPEEAIDIGLHAARLDPAKAVAQGERSLGEEIDRAVDEVVIDRARQPCRTFSEDARTVHEAVDHPAVHVGKDEPKLERPRDERCLVDLVDPV